MLYSKSINSKPGIRVTRRSEVCFIQYIQEQLESLVSENIMINVFCYIPQSSFQLIVQSEQILESCKLLNRVFKWHINNKKITSRRA
jgi:hypothetical protein